MTTNFVKVVNSTGACTQIGIKVSQFCKRSRGDVIRIFLSKLPTVPV